MKRMKKLCLPLIMGVSFLCAAEASDVIAVIDGVPLCINNLSDGAKKLLPEASLQGDVRDVRIMRAVQFELKSRTTLEILSEQNVSCNVDTAKWYIDERSQKYGTNGESFRAGLEKLIHNRGFQLKCAIFKYVQNNYPEKIKLSADDAEAYYRTNQLAYRRNLPGNFQLVGVKADTPQAQTVVSDIRTALLQGESAKSVAARFNAVCRTASPEISALLSKEKNVYKNYISDVMNHDGIFYVAVCVEAPRKGFIPFETVEPFIEEELISHRAGEVFDTVLKQRLSRKIVKYRR